MPMTNPTEGRLYTFLRWLKGRDLRFHLDDDPGDMIWGTGGGHEPTLAEIEHLTAEHAWIWANHSSTEIWDAVGVLWDDLLGGE